MFPIFAVHQELFRRLRTTGIWRGQIRNRRKSGEIYPELAVINAITDDRGVATHYVGLFSDMLDSNFKCVRVSSQSPGTA